MCLGRSKPSAPPPPPPTQEAKPAETLQAQRTARAARRESGAAGFGAPTMLTGPGGVGLEMLAVGRPSLLGS